MDRTEDPDSCLLLAQLDQHCLGQICAKLDPKHMVLFGTACKPINKAATQSLLQLKARYEAWLAHLDLAGSAPACQRGYLEGKLMCFALDGSSRAARQTLAVHASTPTVRRWLRRRCAALGLVVEVGERTPAGSCNVTLRKPQGWQMPWDAKPVPWTPVCDDCGAQLRGYMYMQCFFHTEDEFFLCKTCCGMYRDHERAVAEMCGIAHEYAAERSFFEAWEEAEEAEWDDGED